MAFSLPEPLGVGLTWWAPLDRFIASHRELIDVVEIQPETLWARDRCGRFVCDSAALEHLRILPGHMVAHGVGFPVGGTSVIDPEHLELFASVVADLGCALASEHLSFNRARGPRGNYFTGFMLPPSPTWSGVEHAVEAAQLVKAATPAPFAVEHSVSYLRADAGELRDGEFLAAVAQRADVGIVLDLHNAYANERNGRESMASFLGAIPLERVWELHLAGGEQYADYWLDAHSGPAPDAVRAVAWDIVPHLPNLRLINFELLPAFFERLGDVALEKELEFCQELWAQRRRRGEHCQSSPATRTSVRGTTTSFSDPAAWENELAGAAVCRAPCTERFATDPGVAVLRMLVEEMRAGMLSRALKLTTRLLLLHLGEGGTRRLFESFWLFRPPEFFAFEEAEAFASYVADQCLAIDHLDAVLAFEIAVIRAHVDGVATTVTFSGDPERILVDVAEGRAPPLPTNDTRRLIIDVNAT